MVSTSPSHLIKNTSFQEERTTKIDTIEGKKVVFKTVPFPLISKKLLLRMRYIKSNKIAINNIIEVIESTNRNVYKTTRM